MTFRSCSAWSQMVASFYLRGCDEFENKNGINQYFILFNLLFTRYLTPTKADDPFFAIR